MLEETATPKCMPFMILFLSELRLALNPLTRGSFPWLLYRGWSVAFSCLMRVTLENSSYRPCSLGTPGAGPGTGVVLVKEIYRKRGYQGGGVPRGECWTHSSNGKVNSSQTAWKSHPVRLAGPRGPVPVTLWWWCSGALCARADPGSGYGASWNVGSLPHAAMCSPEYKMHTKGPSDFKDKNVLGARLVLSE